MLGIASDLFYEFLIPGKSNKTRAAVTSVHANALIIGPSIVTNPPNIGISENGPSQITSFKRRGLKIRPFQTRPPEFAAPQ